MSMLLMVKAMKVHVGNSTRKLVLLKLADNANDDGYCWPSYKHVADQCEISRRSAMRHIAELEKEGFITRQYRKGEKGQNRSNHYFLCLDGQKKAAQDDTPQHRTTQDDTGNTEKTGDNLTLGGGDTESLGYSDRESLGVVTESHHPSDTESPGGSDTVSPRTSHSFESVNEPVNKNHIGVHPDKPEDTPKKKAKRKRRQPDPAEDEHFERFWKAGMRKVNKPKARTAFSTKRKKLKMSAKDFADMLIADVQARKDKQFGFDRLHPVTYLNNERWNDEKPLTDPDGRFVGSFRQEDFKENEDGSFKL